MTKPSTTRKEVIYMAIILQKGLFDYSEIQNSDGVKKIGAKKY